MHAHHVRYQPFEAMLFASEVHVNQVRRFTNAPYVEHLAEVAGYTSIAVDPGCVAIATAVAWLHDVREDHGVTYEELVGRFGSIVADGVTLLSDLATGNRAFRKARMVAQLSTAPGWIQTIKVADGLSNYKGIRQFDPKFAVTYRREWLVLIGALEHAHIQLKNMLISELQKPIPSR